MIPAPVRFRFVGFLAWIAAFAALISPASAAQAPPLRFRVDLGTQINAFVREGEVAAHLVLRSGTSPRLLVAFPAGDSGVAVWFAETPTAVTWTLIGQPRPVVLQDMKGRVLRGIEAEATVDAGELKIRQALLSSVRVIRDYVSGGTVPATVLAPASVEGRRLTWSRDRLDGAPGYQLTIELQEGGAVSSGALASGASGRLHLKIVAATGERPLTPLGGNALLTSAAGSSTEGPPEASSDARERDVLEFLSYQEKYLAGSWRFDTYFGRDTLMSLKLLAPALQPDAMESGLESVLVRLSPDGEVAHEEAIGEYAILANAAAGRGLRATPVYDYGMVDESFMLAPVAAQWLLDAPAGRMRAAAFLARRDPTGERTGAKLTRNLLWVVKRTAAFAVRPEASNLIGLKAGHPAGNWRDSRDGLGGGRYPYDVNVVFAPAALSMVDRLVRSGLLDPYLTQREREVLLRAGAQETVWASRAPALFFVRLSASIARGDLTRYGRSIGVEAAPALDAVDYRPVEFDALALNASGRPVPVVHSDVGFALLFKTPTPEELERVCAVLQPFPAGLVTPVGVLVANPVYAGPSVQALFTHTAYHGTVVWSWQQAVLEAGLERQLMRNDLTPAVRTCLAQARAKLDEIIRATARYGTAELWSWSFTGGRFRVEPFEERGREVEEADAAQLWSTVFLAFKARHPPVEAQQ
jgi:hypothetical protein